MVTIVIPTKDEEESLPVLLASVRKQTLQPAEIIVADAKSTDRTREIAHSFGVRVVEGGMPGVGRNAGAREAKTEFILFLDADVELRHPEMLEKAVGEMLERNLDLATCDVFPLSDAYVDHFMHKAYNIYVRAWGSLFPHSPGFCTLVRRRLHEAIGGFDETVVFCEDHEYAQRAVKRGRFGFLHSIKIPVSIRRLDRDGRISIVVRYLFAELHLVALGPIRHDLFRYRFGHARSRDVQNAPHA